MGTRYLLRGALLTLLFLRPGPAPAQSAPNPPYVIEGPTIIQSGRCLSGCVSIVYPQDSAISQSRYVMVPRGNLLFEFPVVSNLGGSIEDASFSVAVIVTGPNAGETTKYTGNVDFNGPGTAKLQIPVEVDWAESAIRFEISVAYVTCYPKARPPKPCSNSGATLTGPNLASISLGLSLPFAFPDDAFLLFVTPAAAFQLPFVPTTIVYGPLGNGPKASSSFSVTQIVATNQQIQTSGSQTVGFTQDDKTGYSVGVSACYPNCKNDATLNLNLGFDVSGSWDSAAEQDTQTSYGNTGTVITQDMLGMQFTVLPAENEPSLDKVTCAAQPFWRDEIIGVVDGQYAAWDYPAGPVLQPLGSVALVVETVGKLDSCVRMPDIPQCDDAHADDPHCTTFSDPVSPQSRYLMLTSQECSALLTLDPFYTHRTQNTHPLSYRLLEDVSTPPSAGPVAASNQHSSTQQITNTSSLQLTSKTTSAMSNSFDVKGGLNLLNIIGINGAFTSSPTTTSVYTDVSAKTLQSQVTYQNQAAVTTTVDDKYDQNVPLKFEQDSTFMGIAVQDTDMNLSCPTTQPPALVSRTETALPPGYEGLPVVRRGQNAAVPRLNGLEPESYIQDTGYGYVVVRRPANRAEIKAQVQARHSDALKRHIARPMPPQSPARITALSPMDTLELLQRIKSPNAIVRDTIKRLQQATAIPQ